MAKRDYVKEIKALKDRAEFTTRPEMYYRLNQLQDFLTAFDLQSERDKELIKIFPVRLVAVIESYFRSVIKELIDHGRPFLDNVPKLKQPNDGKVSIDLLLSLNASEFTLGELIAHVLPCNRISEMLDVLKVLTDKEILSELKTFIPRTIYEHNIIIAQTYISIEPLIHKDIEEVFRIRNIFCHELGTTEELRIDKLGLQITSVSLFINHLDNYLENLIYPNAPETNEDMMNALGHDLDVLEKELDNTIQGIKFGAEKILSPKFDYNLFKVAQSIWEKFREATGKMAAHSCEGGRLYSQLYHLKLIELTRDRLYELKREFKKELQAFEQANNTDA